MAQSCISLVLPAILYDSSHFLQDFEKKLGEFHPPTNVSTSFKMLQQSKMIHQGTGAPPFASHKFLQKKQEILPLTQQGFAWDSAFSIHLHLLILHKTLPAFAFQLLVLEPLHSRILQARCCCYKFLHDFEFKRPNSHLVGQPLYHTHQTSAGIIQILTHAIVGYCCEIWQFSQYF